MSRMWNSLAIVAITLVVPTMFAPAFADPKSEAEFARARNAEIECVDGTRRSAQTAEFEKTPNAEVTPRWPRSPSFSAKEYAAQVLSEKANADFARARNAEIDASLAAVANARRDEAFAMARNAEIDASLAAVAAARRSSDVEINQR